MSTTTATLQNTARMDAHAHLISLGWMGPGHALDSKPYKQKGHRGLAYDPSQATTNTGNGLVKPLLISQRKGNLGIGKKAHEPQAGNDWWLKGFESALGNVGKSESERSSGTSTPVVTPYNPLAGKHGGLYSFFVRGQKMEGTIDKLDGAEKRDSLSSSTKKTKAEKRKIDDLDESDETEKATATAKSKKQKTAEDFAKVSEYIALRDREHKRKARPEKPSPVEEFRQVGEYLAVRSEDKKKSKQKRKSEDENDGQDNPPAIVLAENENPAERVETKEERRERRRRRREEKELRRAGRAARNEAGDNSLDDKDVQDAAAKAARRAERKKRKAEKAAQS